MAASSTPASFGAAFVTPHKSRPSTNNAASTESSMSSTTTPTPSRYLPLLREIQDIQEITADSLNASKAMYDVSTQGVSGTASSSAASRVETSPTTMNSSFSFGVF